MAAKTQASRFFNRELSWIAFNRRVLEEAKRPEKPLLERLKFLTIVSANFDEFYMVRMASLKRQVRAGNYTTCPSHMSPQSQLDACSRESKEIMSEQYRCLHEEILPGLAEQGLIYKDSYNQLSTDQKNYARTFFENQVFPLLTPVRVNKDAPSIPGANLRLQVAFLVVPASDSLLITEEEKGEHLAIVQVPQSLERICFLPDKEGQRTFILLESLLVQYGHTLFPGYEIKEHLVFRTTRDADFGVDETRDEDFVEAMEQVLTGREKSTAVRLNVGSTSTRLQELLQKSLSLDSTEVYDTPEPLELTSLMSLTFINGYDKLKFEGWSPMEPRGLPEDAPLWQTLRERDILLHHPFESFNPVIRMVEEAATDTAVLAIKMTLYRTSGNSPIVRALETAAHNGKQVTVLVELKARFDEQRNISWADRLEQAGVIVVYGIAQIKVHAKALLVIRQETTGICRYLHMATGNYNDKTAKLYTDMGLMTSREDLCYEAGLFFNAITGYSAIPSLNKLIMAPQGMKLRILELIDREAEKSIPENPGKIIAKFNSLADVDVIEALYRASSKGVEIELNIRGICMLVPGVKGQSENIRVTSIIDRYLEHTRAFYFKNGGDEELYLSSADWMPRNLERRVELLFPIEDPDLKERVKRSLTLCVDDRVQSYALESNGTYPRVKDSKGKGISSQRTRYELSRDTPTKRTPINQREFSVRRKPPLS
ncbi:MAG: polyphosphate kinase 1 [Spirochaetales bacterium]|nr:polyphosphate kinase 1 [Spirochaetales bacterium]